MTPVTPQFDEEIHAPLCLRTCALLAGFKGMEFSALRGQLNISDSVLSKHLSRLSAMGYVSIDKITGQGHRRTWVALTPHGHEALAAHLAALREIAALAGEKSSHMSRAGTHQTGQHHICLIRSHDRAPIEQKPPIIIVTPVMPFDP
jgi:DNA-binding MarR family transcriptional regulator